MKTRSVLVLGIILMHLSVIAQVKIGSNPTSINSASLLELESSNQGFVLPRVSIGDVSAYSPMLSNPLTGTIVYNTNSSTAGGSGTGIYLWDGAKWVFISTGSAVSSSAWLLTGNSGLSSSSNFIGTTDAIDFVAKTANTERMRILGAANGSSKAGWIGMGVTVPRSSLDVTGHYTNKNVITIQNTSTTGFSSVDMLDSSGNLAATFGYGNLGTGAFAGKAYFNGYGNDFLFSRGGSNDLLMKGSNGYVGINTGTPSERLHVVGNIYLSGAFMPGGNAGTSGYVLTSAGAGVSPTWNNLNSLSWALTGNSGTSYATNFIGTTDNVSMRFRTNNVQRLIIDSLGRVGIGIGNPSYALSVLSASNPLYLSGLQVTAALSTDSVLTIYNGVVKKTPFSAFASSTTNTLTLSTNTLTSTVNGITATSNAVSSVSNISSANNLSTIVNGVAGSTAPIINSNTNALTQAGGLVTTVNGVAATTSIASGTVSNMLGYNTSGNPVYQPLSNINLSSAWNIAGNAGTNYATNFLGTTDNVSMRFRTNNVQRMIIDSLGNVGIGINNPSYALSVLSASNPLYLSGVLATTALSTDSVLTIYNGIVKKTPFSSFASPTTNTLTLSTNTLTSTVNGIAATSNAVSSVSNISSANNLSTIVNGVAGSTAPIINSNTNALTQAGGLVTTVNGVAATTSIASGTVSNMLGYNTSGNPVYQPLSNINLASAWNITGNAGTNYATNFLGTTDNVSMRFRTNNVQRMIIDSLGKLGIGTSTPTEKLDVSGNIRFSGALMPNNNAGIAGQFLVSSGASTAPTWFDASNYAWQLDGNPVTSIRKFGTTTNYDIPFITSNIERMRLTAGGLLGIGTTNPGYTLSVLAPSNPLYLSGVLATTTFTTDSILTISGGVVKKASYAALTGATTNTLALSTNTLTSTVNGIVATSNAVSGVSNISSANNLSTIVNGVAGSTAPIINSNTETWTQSGGFTAAVNGITANVTPASGTVSNILGYDAGGTPVYQSAPGILSGATTNTLTLNTNTLTSTVNGIAATSNAVSGVSNISSANNLSTIVNGVAGSTAPIINSNTNALTQAGGLVTTVNGVAATTSIASGTISNILGYNASGNPVYQPLNNINLTTAWNITGNSNTNYATNFLGTKDNVSLRLRTNNVQRVIIDSLGNVGIGINNPSYALSVLSASNPLYLSGVLATTALSTDSVLTIYNGIVKKTPFSSFASPTTNTLTLSTNTLTSTVNGIAATSNAVSSVSSISSANNISTIVNGVAGTTAPIINSNTETWTQSGGFTAAVNGITANVTPANGTISSILGYDAGGTPVYQSASGILNGTTTNTLTLSTNTLTSTVNGIAATSNAVSGVSNTSNANKLSTTVNGVAGTVVPIINSNANALTQAGGLVTTVNGVAATTSIGSGTVSNMLGYNASGNPVYQSLSNINLSTAWNLTGNSGTNYATNFLGTTNNVSMRFRTNNVQRMIIDSLGNVGIGISNPSYALSVLSANNPLYLSGVQATSTLNTDSVLTINAGIVKKTPSSSLTNNVWNLTGNAATNSAVNFLGTTDNHPLEFRVNNSIAGYIDSTGGLGNSYFGSNAGYNNTSGNGNTLIGAGADSANTTGSFNTAVGYQTGYSNTSGSSNVFTGYQVGFNNTTGAGNLFSGFQSGYKNTTGQLNIFSGYWSGYLNTTGSNNEFLGYLSGFGNTTGGSNVFVGSQTGSTNTTGSNNTLIGSNSNVLSAALTNATAIGYNAKVALSNSLVLGDTATGNAVNVGIGVRNPVKRLHIDAAPITSAGTKDSLKIDNLATSTSNFNKALLVIDSATGYVSQQNISSLAGNNWSLTGNSGTNYSTNFLGTTDNVSMRFRTNNTERMILDSLGSLGLGSSAFGIAEDREKLLVDYGTTTSNTIASFRGSVDDYFQINLQNRSATGNASTDYVATADDGTDSTYYVDMGINSSKYAFAIDNWGQAHDAYLYSNSKNLFIGTQALNSDVVFLVGGGRAVTNAALRIKGSNGVVVVGKGEASSTPIGNILRGPTGVGTNIAGGSLTITGGGATGTATGGNLYLGSGVSSGTGSSGILSLSTASTERMRIDASGNVGIGITNPPNTLSVLAASNPLYLSGVVATTTFSTDSILTIYGGVVKKAPYSSLPTSSGGSSGWSLTGNSGTNGTVNFLGTTDAQPLVLKSLGRQLAYFDGNVYNIALGYGALNGSSDHNVAIGYNATTNNQYALALGYSALATGVRSVAIGNGASATTASGAEAIAIGYNAISSAAQTIALGYQATASGSYAVALGYGAQATALQSTAIGYSSLASAQYTNAIGYQAQATGLQSTAIGYHAQTAQTNTILLGDVSTPGLHVGIGTATPSAKLDIVASAGNNPLELTGLPTGTAGTDNILTINSSGVVGSVTPATFNGTYWNLNGNAAASGSYLGTTNTTPLQFKFNSTLAGYLDANNTALGTSSSSTAGISNTAVGYSSTASNSATAIGANAAATQLSNTAVGNSATANVSSNATAIGASSQALYQYNVAVGYNAQATLTSQETVIGSSAQAQGQNNIAIGYTAKATGSDKITVVGSSAQAGFQNNTAIGYAAIASTNSQSTAVGASSAASAQNATALGYNAQAITNNQTTAVGASTVASGTAASAFGNNATASATQATAIGSETDATFQNNTAVGYNAQATTSSQATAIGANTSATGSNSTAIGYGATTSQANAIVLGTSSNNVGIGTSTPNTSTKLDVAGSFKLGSSGSVLSNIIKGSATITPTVGLGTTSTYTITIAGATTGANVMVNPRSALANGVVIAYSYVSAANTVTIAFTSGSTTGSLGALTFDVTVIQ